jgi:hypothetical protein
MLTLLQKSASFGLASFTEFHLLLEKKFSCGINVILPVRFCLQKYSVSRLTQIKSISHATPSHMRGVSRSSRTLERDAVDTAAR